MQVRASERASLRAPSHLRVTQPHQAQGRSQGSPSRPSPASPAPSQRLRDIRSRRSSPPAASNPGARRHRRGVAQQVAAPGPADNGAIDPARLTGVHGADPGCGHDPRDALLVACRVEER